MRRRRVISLLSLAGFSLLHGCADSSAPSPATTNNGPGPFRGEAVVVATHFESLPPTDRLLDESVVALNPPLQQSSDIRRLPPVYPITRTTRPSFATPGPQPSFERLPSMAGPRRSPVRLPSLACVTATEPSADAIDRTKVHQSAPTPIASSRLPSIENTVPENLDSEMEEMPPSVVSSIRVVDRTVAKPPLPPLTMQSAATASGSAEWLTTGTSLATVSQRADGMIDRAFLLAEKGAYYSARTEFRQALRTVSQSLDAHFGGNHYSEALAAGWLALEEADDFSAHSQRGPVVDVGLIVETHQTKLLKDYALDDVSPVLAMQHYFSFAQEQLVEACGQAPVASRALYGLGKIHMVLGEKSSSAERLHGPKAMAFQQAALTTDPGNFLAANELGVLLARFGKLPEARSVLQHSVALRPLPETWQNLSVVHQRLGEAELAAQSLAASRVTLQQTGGSWSQQDGGSSMVQWVSPQAFIAQQPGGPATAPTSEPAIPQEPPAQAKRKSGFLWW